jgi:hypothetical protein
MLRYRITVDPRGRYISLPATTSVAAINETFATRAEAQNTAAWLNRLREYAQEADVGHRSVA